MKLSQAKDLFRSLTKSYFRGAVVTFTKQSRVAKPELPLVTISPGSVRRSLNPVYKEMGGDLVGFYESRVSMVIDLYTHGAPVIHEVTKQVVAYENTALDDVLGFANFLGSEYVIEWCHRNDVSILIDGEASDITGLVNDNNYEYRARVTVMFYFTEEVVGHAGILGESSLHYPTEDGKKPVDYESVLGEVKKDVEGIVIPEFNQTSSGGGSDELAEQETGYFTEVEIKEETGNE